MDGGLVASGAVGAEANVAKVEGAVGGTGAGVGVKVGVGATCKAGYKNGVVKLEVGAALGIGGSVSVELDVGSVASKVVNGCKSV